MKILVAGRLALSESHAMGMWLKAKRKEGQAEASALHDWKGSRGKTSLFLPPLFYLCPGRQIPVFTYRPSGTPLHALFPGNRQGRPPELRQVESPRRLAEMAAASGANVAQPAPSGQAHQDSREFLPGGREGRPLYPTIRYVRERTELIHGESELWTERLKKERSGAC